MAEERTCKRKVVARMRHRPWAKSTCSYLGAERVEMGHDRVGCRSSQANTGRVAAARVVAMKGTEKAVDLEALAVVVMEEAVVEGAA